MKCLPFDLIIIVYKHSDYETRIALNKIYKWNYYSMNPLFDFKHPTTDRKLQDFKILKNVNMILRGMSKLKYS
jgi:hypothetical protein